MNTEILKYIIIGLLFILSPFALRYYYIRLMYGNTNIYTGYRKGIRGIKNFLPAIKQELDEKKGLDISQKIQFIKNQLKEASINPDIYNIKGEINSLDQKTANNLKYFLDTISESQENLFQTLKNEVKNGSNVDNIKGIINDIESSISLIGSNISELDEQKISDKIKINTEEISNTFNDNKISLEENILKIKESIKKINKEIEKLLQDRINIEKTSIIVSVKNNDYIENLRKQILGLFSSFWNDIISIFVLLVASSLFIVDYIAMQKLWIEVFNREIQDGGYFGPISIEVAGILFSIFVPLLFFFIFDLLINKSRQGGRAAKIGEILIIVLSVLLTISAFIALIISRVLPELPWDTIDVMLTLFLMPAALIVAYVFYGLKIKNNGFGFIFAPINLILKSVLYIIVSIINTIKLSYKKNYELGAIKNQYKLYLTDKSRLEGDLKNFESKLSGLKEKHDTDFTLKVKNVLSIGSLSEEVSTILGEFEQFKNNINSGFLKINTQVDTLNKGLIGINSKIIAQEEEITKQRTKLENKIQDIEKGFESAMSKKLSLN